MVFGKAATLTALSWRVSVTAVEKDVCQELMTNVRRMKGGGGSSLRSSHQLWVLMSASVEVKGCH